MSRILVRKGYGDSDEEAMRSFGGSEKKVGPKAGDDFSAYKDYYLNYPDAKLAYDSDLRDAQANSKSTGVPVPEPTFEPGELTSEELAERTKEQEIEQQAIARAERVAGMGEEEKMKFLGEELAERTEASRTQKVTEMGEGKEFAESVLPNLNLGATSESPNQGPPSAPEDDGDMLELPPSFKHGFGATARKVFNPETGRMNRVIIENREGGAQGSGISHNMTVTDPSGTHPFFRPKSPKQRGAKTTDSRMREGTRPPKESLKMHQMLGRFISQDPKKAAELFGYDDLIDRKTTSSDDREGKRQLQIAMALHAMRQDDSILPQLINNQGLQVEEQQSAPMNPEQALAEVKRKFPQVTVPSEKEKLAVKIMREQYPFLREGTTLANVFSTLDGLRDEDGSIPEYSDMSAEELQELTVGQGEEVVPDNVGNRMSTQETEDKRLNERIKNSFPGGEEGEGFEEYRTTVLDRLDAQDQMNFESADEAAQRIEQLGYQAEPFEYGTPMDARGFGTERTDDPIQTAIDSAMMIHQKGQDERPDEYPDMDSALASRGSNEAEVSSTLQSINVRINELQEHAAEQGERSAQLRASGRSNPVEDKIMDEIETLMGLREDSLQQLRAVKDSSRQSGTPAPTAGLAGLARDFQQGNVVGMDDMPSELRVGAKRGGFDPNVPIQGLPSQARGAVMPVTPEQSREATERDSRLDTRDVGGMTERDRRAMSRGAKGNEKDENLFTGPDLVNFPEQGAPAPQAPQAPPAPLNLDTLMENVLGPKKDDDVQTGFPMSVGTQLLKGIHHDLYYKGV